MYCDCATVKTVIITINNLSALQQYYQVQFYCISNEANSKRILIKKVEIIRTVTLYFLVMIIKIVEILYNNKPELSFTVHLACNTAISCRKNKSIRILGNDESNNNSNSVCLVISD